MAEQLSLVDTADALLRREARAVTGCTGCSRCGEAHEGGLYGRVAEGRHLCATCWELMGRPYPQNPPTQDELHKAELAARDAMTRRGGEDRYRVRAGKT